MLTAPVVVIVSTPPRLRGGAAPLPRPSTRPLGATENVPALMLAELERTSILPLPRTVTLRVPKSSVQPSLISKALLMLQGLLLFGQFAVSLLMTCAAVQTGIACATAGNIAPSKTAMNGTTDARRIAPCSGCLVVRLDCLSAALGVRELASTSTSRARKK